MTQDSASPPRHSNAYNIFILILTVLSLIIMVVMFLPLDDATLGLLRFYDNLICVIFLIDFLLNLKVASKKADYFIERRGWLDLLGSIPAIGGAYRFTGLFRLARLSRLARITRLLRGENKNRLIGDIVRNRGQYSAFLTILLTIIVLTTTSVLVLQFESHSPNANIHTGWDAFWFSVVTITTVGYGDRYPVTSAGRITAMFIMFMGVGIIGALASFLSSILIGSPPSEEEGRPAGIQTSDNVEERLENIEKELFEIRHLLEKK